MYGYVWGSEFDPEAGRKYLPPREKPCGREAKKPEPTEDERVPCGRGDTAPPQGKR